MRFEDLRLNEPLLRAVRTAGYHTPTLIQSQAIPHVLAGRDVLGCAQTGTGKTAAFALPILQRFCDGSVSREQREGRMRALVLCPTRELAQQIYDNFDEYGRHTKIRQAVIFGGVHQDPQVHSLRSGLDILIATPGRLLDLMGQNLVNLGSVEILVLDEADRMLDMGFLPDLRRVLAQVPEQRQTLFFSATMPDPIRKLANDLLRQPATVQVDRVSSPTPTVDHWVFHVEKPDKPTLLARFLTHTSYTRVLVFSRTKYGADRLARRLMHEGIRAASIHGDKGQSTRVRTLAEFRSALTPVLVATDIAARGLDVDDISHVINYDLTPDPETYVHRIGRTGRAGASGTAVSFCTSEDRANLRDIERLLRAPLQVAAELPEYSPVAAPKPRLVSPPPSEATQMPHPAHNPMRQPNDSRRHKPRHAARTQTSNVSAGLPKHANRKARVANARKSSKAKRSAGRLGTDR